MTLESSLALNLNGAFSVSTTCRLWVRVPPDRRNALNRCWQTQLAPRLAVLGLEVRPCPRPLPEDVVAWVFAVGEGRSLASVREVLHADLDWEQVLRSVTVEDSMGAATWGLDLFATSAEKQIHHIARGTRQGPWLTLDPHDGMPSCLISDLLSDHHGHLYLAAYEGLVHFDGATATLITTAGASVQGLRCLAIHDGSDDLWLSPAGPGLARWDGKQFEWYGAADGLPDDSSLLACAGVGQQLWLSRAGEMGVRFDGERFGRVDLRLPGDHQILCAWSDGEQSLLLGTQSGLWRVGADTRCIGMAHMPVHALCRDSTGCLWLSAGNAIYRQSTDGFEAFSAFENRSPASSITGDGVAGVWLTYRGHGVSHWDGQCLTEYGLEKGLFSNDVNALHVDRRGTVWVGAWGGGLSRFDGRWIRSVPMESAADVRRVETVCEDARGQIWIGTWGGGVMRIDEDGAHPVQELDDCGRFLWSSLLDSQGNLWFGSLECGAGCWDGKQLRMIGADRLGHPSVWDIHQDRRNRMWFATQGGGLTCLDGDNAVTYTTVDGLPDDGVWSVIEDDAGDIWCSTLNSGVSHFDGQRFKQYTVEDGLAHDQVWCSLRDRDGHLWFGTWGGGVSRFDGQCFTTYNTRDGLANNSVRTIHQSRDGHLWFGTYGGGVSRFDGRAFQTFARRDGLGHDAVQSIIEATDGTIWIATENGVSAYVPPTTPPAVRVDGLIADRRYTDADQDIVLSATQGLVTFEFSGASFSTPRERLVYAHRLRGHEKTWQTTTRRRAEMRDLPEGDYTFQVRAIDRDLNYSPPAEVGLRVEADSDTERLRALQAELAVAPGLEHFIGCSAPLQQILGEIETVAGSDLTVLILGETGTGKGLAARGIHALSAHAEGPFIQVNCGAIPEGLVESELFGHEKGAFTGALSRKIGRFELAEGGTLFLDEIGDLPLASQRVLLHALQEGIFHRVGGQTPIQAKVRVIAATNRRLDHAARDGAFRDDLYFRLSPFILRVPPLRVRQDDIPLLVEHFVESFARHLNRPVPVVRPAALAALQQYDWPGNVRELEHVAQRAVLVCRADVIDIMDLAVGDILVDDDEIPNRRTESPVTLDELDVQLSDQERAHLLRVLEEANWVIYGERGAARRLGTHPEKLRRRLRRLGLRRPG